MTASRAKFRYRVTLVVLVTASVASGLTAIPVEHEVAVLARGHGIPPELCVPERAIYGFIGPNGSGWLPRFRACSSPAASSALASLPKESSRGSANWFAGRSTDSMQTGPLPLSWSGAIVNAQGRNSRYAGGGKCPPK